LIEKITRKNCKAKNFCDEDRFNSLISEMKPYKDGYKRHPVVLYLYKGGILYYENTEENRTHPDLIEVVEKLGKDAWGDFAKLKILEIPDDIDYYIDNYDGWETIHENHKVWD